MVGPLNGKLVLIAHFPVPAGRDTMFWAGELRAKRKEVRARQSISLLKHSLIAVIKIRFMPGFLLYGFRKLLQVSHKIDLLSCHPVGDRGVTQ